MVVTIGIIDVVTGKHAGHVPFHACHLIIKLVSFACSAFSRFNIAIIPIVDWHESKYCGRGGLLINDLNMQGTHS